MHNIILAAAFAAAVIGHANAAPIPYDPDTPNASGSFDRVDIKQLPDFVGAYNLDDGPRGIFCATNTGEVVLCADQLKPPKPRKGKRKRRGPVPDYMSDSDCTIDGIRPCVES